MNQESARARAPGGSGTLARQRRLVDLGVADDHGSFALNFPLLFRDDVLAIIHLLVRDLSLRALRLAAGLETLFARHGPEALQRPCSLENATRRMAVTAVRAERAWHTHRK